MSIGSRIQQARVRSGLTREQAAEQLHVSRQTISNWENDKTLPDVAFAKDISWVYGISLDELISGTPTENNPVPSPTKIDNHEALGKACLGMYWEDRQNYRFYQVQYQPRLCLKQQILSCQDGQYPSYRHNLRNSQQPFPPR